MYKYKLVAFYLNEIHNLPSVKSGTPLKSPNTVHLMNNSAGASR